MAVRRPPTRPSTKPEPAAAPVRPVIIRGPQSRPQEMFFAAPEDIVVYGGAAGGGKTWGLLLEAARYIASVRGFNAVIFRRTFAEIRKPGGMWDESFLLYRGEPLYGESNEQLMQWTFPPFGNTITFAHMQHEHDRFDWQGSQIAMIGFDELTTFSQIQFDYMLSRNRSTCGVRPYLRATCNPDADHWIAKVIAWWIDPGTGYPMAERAGVPRWFKRGLKDEFVWSAAPDGLLDPADPENRPISFTFIPATIHDNAILLAKDPGYLTKLKQLPLVERERLLAGNWKIRPQAGSFFDRAWFRIVEGAPSPIIGAVRYWDKAGTKVDPGANTYDPSWTVGVRMALCERGEFLVDHVVRGQWQAADREEVIRQTALADRRWGAPQGLLCLPALEQEPGSGGKESAERTRADLARLLHLSEDVIAIDKVTGSKESRAQAYAFYAKSGRVYLQSAGWNEEFLDEHFRFPLGSHDDQVDASSGAFNRLALYLDEIAHGTAPSDERIEAELAGAGIPASEMGGSFLDHELF